MKASPRPDICHMCLHMGLVLIVLLHGLDGGVLNGLQLFLFRLGGGVLENDGGEVTTGEDFPDSPDVNNRKNKGAITVRFELWTT